jgi:hypothetical protein
MGGVFSAPKPAAGAAASGQAGAEADDSEAEARRKAVARARRGLGGTIATSDRGVLAPLPAFALRKTLLGE